MTEFLFIPDLIHTYHILKNNRYSFFGHKQQLLSRSYVHGTTFKIIKILAYD